MTPRRCGVSDAAFLLAEELRAGFGIETAFTVLNAGERSRVPQRTLYCGPEQLLENCLELTEGRRGAILVHLSGYGYSPDGAPAHLAKAIAALRQSGQFQIAVYFHELFFYGKPWQSGFWYAGRQKRVMRDIARHCDWLVTNTDFHAKWLEREVRLAAPVALLPVFSTVGEAVELRPVAEREAVLAVFGLPGPRQRAYKQLPSLGTTLRALGIKAILDVGMQCGAPCTVQGLPVTPMGEQSAEDLAALFSRVRFGFVPMAPNALGKSSTFAGFCALGAIPVVATPFSEEVDGLRDGVQVVSSRTVNAVLRSGLQPCSQAAFQWYRGHRRHVHAASYARWMDGVEAKNSVSAATAAG